MKADTMNMTSDQTSKPVLAPVVTDAPAPSARSKTPAINRYAPDPSTVATGVNISDADVLAVIDARGGRTYSASIDTGLANRFPYASQAERHRAVTRALKSGAIVRTPMGVFRRPPGDDD